MEISCHGSPYIQQQLLALLMARGCRMADPGEFTLRAFLNGKMDLAQAEAVADLIAALNKEEKDLALSQLQGSVSNELALLRERLLHFTSLIELELDFADHEELEFADRSELNDLAAEIATKLTALIASFKTGNAIRNGIPVAIVGAPNVGKSTILNALLGTDRAIVSDIQGTTRDTIEETLNLNGILFRFIDTAGIRESSDTVEKIGIERTFRKISEAEIVLCLLDSRSEESDFLNNLELLFQHVDTTLQEVFILLNKADQIAPQSINKNVSAINKIVSCAERKVNILTISAKEQNGLQELKDALYTTEKGLIPNEDSTFVTNVRHFEALQNASAALSDCRTSLSRGIPSDLVAEDLRRALSAINSILGADLLDPEVILHNIFRNHCIGK